MDNLEEVDELLEKYNVLKLHKKRPHICLTLNTYICLPMSCGFKEGKGLTAARKARVVD